MFTMKSKGKESAKTPYPAKVKQGGGSPSAKTKVMAKVASATAKRKANKKDTSIM